MGKRERQIFDLMTLLPGETILVTAASSTWAITATKYMKSVDDMGKWIKGMSVMVRSTNRRNPVLDLVDPESFLLERMIARGSEYFYRPDRGSTNAICIGSICSLFAAHPDGKQKLF